MKKVLITGTGRSGTTFLVALFTELGYDTGFTVDNYMNNVFEHCKGGLEHQYVTESSPYIVKNPNFCFEIPNIIERGINIELVLIPIRDIDFVAKSRVNHGNKEGGIWLTDKNSIDEQKYELYKAIGVLVSDLVYYSVPHEFIHFERMVSSPLYLYEKVKKVIPDVSYNEFCNKYAKITPLFTGGENK